MKTTDTKAVRIRKEGKNKAAKKYAVSVRAYDDFTSRIRSALATDADACRETLQLLETSVGHDVEAIGIDECSIKAQIAFLMIKPEIELTIYQLAPQHLCVGRRSRGPAGKLIQSHRRLQHPLICSRAMVSFRGRGCAVYHHTPRKRLC